MDIQFVCPYCREHLRVDSSNAGRPVRCPKCNGVMVVPAVGSAPAPAPNPPASTPDSGAPMPSVPAPTPESPGPTPESTPSMPNPPATMAGAPASMPNSPAPSGVMFCPKCGERNMENNFRCIRCGFVLHGPTQPAYVAVDDGTMGGLIPYKNSQALLAYYFGVFSLIPCLGIPLGIAAVVLGIRGLKQAGRHPEARGRVHAWVGIVLGGLCAAGYLALTVLMPKLLGILE